MEDYWLIGVGLGYKQERKWKKWKKIQERPDKKRQERIKENQRESNLGRHLHGSTQTQNVEASALAPTRRFLLLASLTSSEIKTCPRFNRNLAGLIETRSQSVSTKRPLIRNILHPLTCIRHPASGSSSSIRLRFIDPISVERRRDE